MCAPPTFLLSHPFSSFWQRLVKAQRLSSLSLCFPGKDGKLLVFPCLAPLSWFVATVSLLAVTESPGQGCRTQARSGWVRAAREAANDCQSTKSFPPRSSHCPAPSQKLLWGAPMTGTLGITPARRRDDEAHRSGRVSSLQPWQPRMTQPTQQCSSLPPGPSLPSTCI